MSRAGLINAMRDTVQIHYPKLSFTCKRIGACTKCGAWSQVSKQFTSRDGYVNNNLQDSLGLLKMECDDWLKTPHICSTCQTKGKENE
jgi:hypothetical protein